MTSLFTAPTVEVMPARHFAGITRRYDMNTRSAIPVQWRDYNAAQPQLAGLVPDAWYGVCYNFGEGMSFDYLSGQEAVGTAALQTGFATVGIIGAYARFATLGHISAMQSAWAEIYGDWLKRPEYRPRPGPTVEYYPPAFDGATGEGGYEIWVAVA